MKKSLFTYWTFHSCLFLTIFYALDLIPAVGIFLMFGMAIIGPLWSFLPHLITLGIIADVVGERFPKKALLIPAAAYSLYYAFFAYEYLVLRSIEKNLQVENSSQALQFNPSLHSLVMAGGDDLVNYYKIPVVYERSKDFPRGYISHHMISADRCLEVMKLHREEFKTSQIYWNRSSNLRDRIRLKECNLRAPAEPAKVIIEVTTKDTETRIRGILVQETIYSISKQHHEIGVARNVSIMRMPMLPALFAGCFLNSSKPSWDCSVHLLRKRIELQAMPGSTGEARYGSNIAAEVLKLKRYQDSDFANFVDFAENALLIDGLMETKKAERPEDFDEWGNRKDSIFSPIIRTENGIEKYTGVVYSGPKGGPFFSFIKRNEGKTVFLDVTFGPNVNHNHYQLGIFGVCKGENNCMRIDHHYEFRAGKSYANIQDRILGYWKVDFSKTFSDAEDPRGDTVNELTSVTME